MPFERFTKTGRGYTPKASIWSRGQIGFNRGAVERFNIKNYQYAVLFYDRETNRIGIKFTKNPSEGGAAKIIFGETGAFISAKAFLSYYDLLHEKTVKYDIVFSDEDDLYIMQL